MNIQIISGSPRNKSITRRVAYHLKHIIEQQINAEVNIIDLKDHDMPPMETVFTSVEDTPEKFKELSRNIFKADAFIMVTPEYNGSYSPSMKNLLDHFPKQQHKVFGIVTASPGSLGGMRAAMQLQQLIFGLYGIGSPHMLIVPMVDKKFNEEGELTDPSFKKSVDLFVSEFLWLTEKITSK